MSRFDLYLLGRLRYDQCLDSQGSSLSYENQGIIEFVSGLRQVIVSFLFADTGVEVLPLLQIATREIEQVANDIYSLI